MSPTLVLAVLVALSLYMAGMLAVRTLLNWIIGKHSLKYPDVVRERDLQMFFWLPLLVYHTLSLLGLVIRYGLSGHWHPSRR